MVSSHVDKRLIPSNIFITYEIPPEDFNVIIQCQYVPKFSQIFDVTVGASEF